MEFGQAPGIPGPIRCFDTDRPVEREEIRKVPEAMRIASCAMNTRRLPAVVVQRDDLPRETFEKPSLVVADVM